MSHLSEINVPEKAPRRIGIVESDARDQTRKVVIKYSVKHPKYGKYIRRRSVLQVHDAKNESHLGDRVEVAECRPISKTKSWILTRVIEKAIGSECPPGLIETFVREVVQSRNIETPPHRVIDPVRNHEADPQR